MIFRDASLGVIDAYGVGVSQDYAEAAKWFRKSADGDMPGPKPICASCTLMALAFRETLLRVLEEPPNGSRRRAICSRLDFCG